MQFPDIEGIASFEAAKVAFRAALYAAAAQKELPALAEFCETTFATTANGFVRPYAFAYAARALLHQRTSYAPDADRILRLLPAPRDRIEALLRAPAAVNDRDNYYYDIVTGIRDYVLGDIGRACWNFARAARFNDLFRVVRDDFGGGASFGRSFPTSADLTIMRDALLPCAYQEQAMPPGSWRLAVSSHADSLYAEAFFPNWIEQLGALRCDGLLLHLHIMFRHDRDEALLARFAAMAAEHGMPLFITSEAGQPRDKAYFAGSRFLRARDLIERFDCNTLFVDADAFIVDQQKFAEIHLPHLAAETAVTGMIAPVFAEGYLPWRRFSAGWLVVPRNPAGIRFAELLHGCMNHFWDPRFGRNWWIDQFCLEAARSIMIREQAVAAFRSWPATYPDSIAAVGERNKIARVSETATVRSLMGRGLTFHQAMIQINRGEAGPA